MELYIEEVLSKVNGNAGAQWPVATEIFMIRSTPKQKDLNP